jgi:hypothetical protein
MGFFSLRRSANALVSLQTLGSRVASALMAQHLPANACFTPHPGLNAGMLKTKTLRHKSKNPQPGAKALFPVTHTTSTPNADGPIKAFSCPAHLAS